MLRIPVSIRLVGEVRMKSLLIGASSKRYVSTDTDVLKFGTATVGYYGIVAAKDFLTLDQVLSVAGVTVGTSNTAANADDWFKFSANGKALYISKKILRNNLSRDQLNSQGVLNGKTVTVNGKQYKVRSLTSAEWQQYMYKVNSAHPSGAAAWDEVSNDDMGLNLAGTIVSNVSQAWGYQTVNQSGTITTSLAAATRGWRAVFELVS